MRTLLFTFLLVLLSYGATSQDSLSNPWNQTGNRIRFTAALQFSYIVPENPGSAKDQPEIIGDMIDPNTSFSRRIGGELTGWIYLGTWGIGGQIRNVAVAPDHSQFIQNLRNRYPGYLILEESEDEPSSLINLSLYGSRRFTRDEWSFIPMIGGGAAFYSPVDADVLMKERGGHNVANQKVEWPEWEDGQNGTGYVIHGGMEIRYNAWQNFGFNLKAVYTYSNIWAEYQASSFENALLVQSESGLMRFSANNTTISVGVHYNYR